MKKYVATLSYLLFINILFVDLPAQHHSILAGQMTGDSIHYVDLVPDTKFEGIYGERWIHWNLDMNSDGINDFHFTFISWCQVTQSVDFFVRNKWASQVAVDTQDYALALGINDLIDASLNWQTALVHPKGTIIEEDEGANYGNFVLEAIADTAYLAVRIPVLGEWFYGWIHIVSEYSLWCEPTVTILDYAWHGDINAVRLLDSKFSNSTSLYPNPNSGMFYLDFASELNSVKLKVYDLSGKLLYQSEIQKKELIDLQHLPSGMYHAIIESEKGRVIRKIIIN